MNRKIFYDGVRASLFGGSLNADQVGGMETILNAWNANPISSDPRHLAYPLATTFLETAYTMQPIKEAGGRAYFTRLYDVAGDRPALAKKMGNVRRGDGPRYCGRGYVQITWYVNYEKASRVVGYDLIADPDAAMRPEFAAPIMFLGMRDGWFTGHSLSRYFNQDVDDPVGARRIINGTDRAGEIAEHHVRFLDAIMAAHG